MGDEHSDSQPVASGKAYNLNQMAYRVTQSCRVNTKTNNSTPVAVNRNKEKNILRMY